jgi:hypothetical protein
MGFSGLDLSKASAWDQYSFSKVFFEGDGPNEIHLHGERIKISEIPGITNTVYDPRESTPPEFEKWLRNRFLMKDVLMDCFYRYGHFPTESEDGQGLKQIYKVGPDYMDWISALALMVAWISSFSWFLF